MIALFGRTPSLYYVKNSSNKQREMTVHHYFKENVKNLECFFKCSCKNHHEDRLRNGRPRVTSAAEDKFIRVTSLRGCSPNKSHRVQVTDTSQHQLFRGDCVNQAFMVKLWKTVENTSKGNQ